MASLARRLVHDGSPEEVQNVEVSEAARLIADGSESQGAGLAPRSASRRDLSLRPLRPKWPAPAAPATRCSSVGLKRVSVAVGVACCCLAVWFHNDVSTRRNHTDAQDEEALEQKSTDFRVAGMRTNCPGCHCDCTWATHSPFTYAERCTINDGSCCWACCCHAIANESTVFHSGAIVWALNATMCLTPSLPNGTQLAMYSCEWGETQHWVIPRKGMIRHKQNLNRCIKVPDKPSNASNALDGDFLELADCDDKDFRMQFSSPDHGQGPIRWVHDESMCINVGRWRIEGKHPGVRAQLRRCEDSRDEVHPDSLFLLPFVNVGDNNHAHVRGHYGYLTEFWIGPEEMLNRTKQMYELFRILEFQFFFAFEGYSKPPDIVRGNLANWKCKVQDRPVHANTVKAATSEIFKHGGRSWLGVLAHGTDSGDELLQDGFPIANRSQVNHKVHSHYFETLQNERRHNPEASHSDVCGCDVEQSEMVKPHATTAHAAPMDVVPLCPAWAIRFVPRWAKFAQEMGFSGIHWDTFGDLGQFNHTDIPGFLRAAMPYMQYHNLQQTLNFVDGFGWDPELALTDHVIAFPYWEVWTNPVVEEQFYRATDGLHSVIVCYPGWSQFHCCAFNERQNAEAYGLWPMDVGLGRWKRAKTHGSTYMFVGDGMRHLQGPFLPDSLEMATWDITKIQEGVGVHDPIGPGGPDPDMYRYVPQILPAAAPAPAINY